MTPPPFPLLQPCACSASGRCGGSSRGDGAQLFPRGQGLAGPQHPSQAVPSWLGVGDGTIPALTEPGSNCSTGSLDVLGRL